MHPGPQPAGSVNKLALACSALARAGQTLSVIQDPSQAKEALRQAEGLLSGNAVFADLPIIQEMAGHCRALAMMPEEADMPVRCRQLAAQLARSSGRLATEIQQQGARAAAKVPAPAGPTPAPAVPSAPAAAPAPPSPPAPVAPKETKPAPAPPTPSRPAPKPASTSRPAAPKPAPTQSPVPQELVQRTTIARSEEEKRAVAGALQEGRRFALIGNGGLIDIETNLMWTAQPGPAGPHGAAQVSIEQSRACGVTGWRLPSPAELAGLLAGGGRKALDSLRVIPARTPAGAPCRVWTGEVRSKWFGLKKEVAVTDLASGTTSWASPQDPSVAAVAVRAPR